jgi:hypothetical protein
MTIPYNLNIPNPPNDPSADVPLMKANTNAINTLVAVDHIPFNNSLLPNGTHVQTTFAEFSSPVAPAGLGSVMYPAAGVADNTKAQLYFQNPNTTLLLSCIKAFATISVQAPNAAPVTLVSPNSWNVNVTTSRQTNLVSNVTTITFLVNLNSNTVVGSDACVLITTNGASVGTANSILTSYTLASNVLTIIVVYSGGPIRPTTVNFVVIQA